MGIKWEHTMCISNRFIFRSRDFGLGLLALLLVSGESVRADETPGDITHFLRGAYQYGAVLKTNEFVEGDNLKGEPIDTFHAIRLEFGWQTDGSSDWHHLYNFPSYGIGLYSADYFNEEELGKPTSVYGFFNWPAKRWSDRWQWSVDISFGLTDNWVAYDPQTNPKNIAMGAAHSVHFDLGTNIEYRFARHWSVLGGFSFTHFSNGGSAQPNSGINQIAPILFAKYSFQESVIPVKRSDFTPYEPGWDWGLNISGGSRNVSHNTADLPNPERTVYRSYFIGTMLASINRQTSRVTRWAAGMDLTYDESVGDLVRLEGMKQGIEQSASDLDYWSLGLFGGYERVINRAEVYIHLGYMFLRRDIDAQVPRLFQRVGLHYFIWSDISAGLGVRLNDFSRANNLEFSVGYRFGK